MKKRDRRGERAAWAIASFLFAAGLLSVAAVCVSKVEKLPESTVKLQMGGASCSGAHLGKGVVITAAHCAMAAVTVKNSSQVTVPGEWLWLNRAYDVALIHSKDLVAANARLSCTLAPIGTEIVVSGNPVGLEFIKTRGRVVSEQLNEESKGEASWQESQIVDVTAGPGNSGGPVFDAEGVIRGILVGGWRGLGLSIIVPGPTLCKLLGR